MCKTLWQNKSYIPAFFNCNGLYCQSFYGNARTAFDFKIKNAIKDIIDLKKHGRSTQLDRVGLIETEIERDLTQREAQTEAEEKTDVSRD